MARHHHKYRPKLSKRLAPFDVLVYFFAVATPLCELPQAYAIFSTHSARDVSLSTWAFFTVSSFVWLAYGLRRQVKAIALSSVLYFVIEAVVVAGILRYR